MEDRKYSDEHGVEITLCHCQTCGRFPDADVAMIAHQWAGMLCGKCEKPIRPKSVTVTHLPMARDGKRFCLPVAQWLTEPSIIVVVSAASSLRTDMHRECAVGAMEVMEVRRAGG